MDFIFTYHGTIGLLRPLTEAAEEWLDANIADDAQWFGNALAIEHRYIDAIIDGIINDGLSVE
jgi:hypothetical protein